MRHQVLVSEIPGVTGPWDVSTTARMDILRSLVWARENMQRDAVWRLSWCLVMSPEHWRAVAVTQEVFDHVRLGLASSSAMPRLVKGLPMLHSLHGFPLKRCAAAKHPELIGYSFQTGLCWSVQFVDFVSAAKAAGSGPIPGSSEVQDGDEQEGRPEGGEEREKDPGQKVDGEEAGGGHGLAAR